MTARRRGFQCKGLGVNQEQSPDCSKEAVVEALICTMGKGGDLAFKLLLDLFLPFYFLRFLIQGNVGIFYTKSFKEVYLKKSIESSLYI